MKMYMCVATMIAITSCAQVPESSILTSRTQTVSAEASCQSLGDECDKNHPCCGSNVCATVSTYGGICEKKE